MNCFYATNSSCDIFTFRKWTNRKPWLSHHDERTSSPLFMMRGRVIRYSWWETNRPLFMMIDESSAILLFISFHQSCYLLTLDFQLAVQISHTTYSGPAKCFHKNVRCVRNLHTNRLCEKFHWQTKTEPYTHSQTDRYTHTHTWR